MCKCEFVIEKMIVLSFVSPCIVRLSIVLIVTDSSIGKFYDIIQFIFFVSFFFFLFFFSRKSDDAKEIKEESKEDAEEKEV